MSDHSTDLAGRGLVATLHRSTDVAGHRKSRCGAGAFATAMRAGLLQRPWAAAWLREAERNQWLTKDPGSSDVK
jgi:hypothetical protein